MVVKVIIIVTIHRDIRNRLWGAIIVKKLFLLIKKNLIIIWTYMGIILKCYNSNNSKLKKT